MLLKIYNIRSTVQRGAGSGEGGKVLQLLSLCSEEVTAQGGNKLSNISLSPATCKGRRRRISFEAGRGFLWYFWLYVQSKGKTGKDRVFLNTLFSFFFITVQQPPVGQGLIITEV